MRQLTTISLFAGIGGFDLGFERAGLKTLAVVEKDATCRRVLAAKFPGAAQFDDVRTVGANNLPACDVLTGGFPCQDLSVAGDRAGLGGSRSGLFYELTRITHELKPAFVVWENVPGLYSSRSGHDFLAILVEFRRIGYSGAWRTLNAQYFGVAQRRRRCFGVFARDDLGAERCAQVLSLGEGVRWHPEPRRQTGEKVAINIGSGSAGSGGYRLDADTAKNLIPEMAWALQERDAKGADSSTKEGHLIPVVASPITAGYSKGTGANDGKKGSPQNLLCFSSKDHGADAGDLSPTLRSSGQTESHANGGAPPAVAFQARGVRRLTPRECERLQGFPDDWTAGFADAPRYKMLGNAVAVPCAEWIGRRIVTNFP